MALIVSLAGTALYNNKCGAGGVSEFISATGGHKWHQYLPITSVMPRGGGSSSGGSGGSSGGGATGYLGQAGGSTGVISIGGAGHHQLG